MTTYKVLYFLAGLVPTTNENNAVAALAAMPGYDVQVRTNKVANVHGNLEDCDYLAGTRPAAYDAEDYPAPPNLGIVTDAQEIAVVGGTVTVSVSSAGVVTAAFEADP